jgi:hypothetical protein
MPNWLSINNDEDKHKIKGWVAKAPPGTFICFKKPCRTADQNRLLWARLGDIARQVDWYGEKLSAEDWKDVFTASLRKAKVVPGLEGGFVVLGLRTSSMSKQEMTNLLELIAAFGAEKDVKFETEQQEVA